MYTMPLPLGHVQRLIKRWSQVPSNGVQPTLSPRGLPTELLLQIFSYLDLRDISVLNRTSKHFKNLTDAKLYNSLRIGLASPTCKLTRIPLDERRQALLYRTLQAARPSGMVTELRIDFSWCGTRKIPLPRTFSRVRCTCDKLDYQLGQALVSLLNIRVIHFSCHCCRDPTDSRHLYLQNLKSTQLRGLTFDCQCMPIPSKKLYIICAAPCMRSVTALEWPKRLNTPEPSTRALIEDKECMPNLRGLYFHANVDSVAPFIEKGTLKYIRCSYWTQNLQELLDKHPGTITTLRIKRQRSTLPALIGQYPETYRSLQRVGQFYHTTKEVNELLSYLSPLTCLPEIKAMDIIYRRDSDVSFLDPWTNEEDDGLVPRIGDQHPTLRRIYLESSSPYGSEHEGARYYIWRSDEYSWQLQCLPGIEQWREIPNWSWKGAGL